MQVRIALVNDKVKTTLPHYTTEGAGCFDIYATSHRYVERYFDEKSGEYKGGYDEYGTNLIFEIPKGYVGIIVPRSSVRDVSQSLANSSGRIDHDYRGEVLVSFKQDTRYPESYRTLYKEGDRVAQMHLMEAPQVTFEQVDKEELTPTERGDKGHGSTGRAKTTRKKGEQEKEQDDDAKGAQKEKTSAPDDAGKADDTAGDSQSPVTTAPADGEAN